MQEKKLPSKQTMGDRIKARRRHYELTQRSLAEKVGLSPAAIGRMESERDYVSSRPTIIALAQALGCSPDWLETGIGETFGPRLSDEVVAQRDRETKSFMDALPSDARAAVSAVSHAGAHYVGMEYLLDKALKTRAPIKDPAAEEEFKLFLRDWAKKRVKGRAAMMRALDLLDVVARMEIDRHVADSLHPPGKA